MADLNIPHGVLEAAAERASGEQQSLSEVVTALLRDYAEGRTWANLPVGAVMAVIAGLAQPPEGTVTEWGLRLDGGSGVPVFERYRDEQSAQDDRDRFQGPFNTAVVSRQVGPWTEAPEPAEDEKHG